MEKVKGNKTPTMGYCPSNGQMRDIDPPSSIPKQESIKTRAEACVRII